MKIPTNIMNSLADVKPRHAERAERNPISERRSAMIRHIVSAAALATLALAAPALAQNAPSSPQATAAAQPSSSDVDACVAQMHRMAGLNKGLAANWNADRVRRDCAAGVYGR